MRKRRPPMKPMFNVLEAAARPIPKWRKATKAERQGARLRVVVVTSLIMSALVVIIYWTQSILDGGSR